MISPTSSVELSAISSSRDKWSRDVSVAGSGVAVFKQLIHSHHIQGCMVARYPLAIHDVVQGCMVARYPLAIHDVVQGCMVVVGL